MRHERLLQRANVLIVQSCLYPPPNDEQDIIDTQQRDSLSIGGIIRATQPTYCMDVFQRFVCGKFLITKNAIRGSLMFYKMENQLS